MATSPDMVWHWAHLIRIRQYLAAVERGEINKIMFFLPPRHGKSEMITIRFPAYLIENTPKKRAIVGAYNVSLAEDFSRKTRRILKEKGIVEFSNDKNTAGQWETTEGGGLIAVGVGAGVTGKGGDIIIIDDPVKSREEAESATYRERVWDWYTNDLYTRRNSANAPIVLIMTRWHDDDLAGRILKSEDAPNWKVVSFPAIAEANDPLGRRVGEALCPERFDIDALNSIKVVLGSDFDSLYQQHPRPREGSLFKYAWFVNSVIPAIAVPRNLRWVRYYDLAYSLNRKADNTATIEGAFSDGNVYLRRGIAGKMEAPESRKMIVGLMLSEPHTTHGVEAAVHGTPTVQEIRRDQQVAHVALIGVQVHGDKLVRANVAVPRAEAGRIYFVKETPNDERWIREWIDEMCAFPYGEHDDRVDAVSGVFQMLARGKSGDGLSDAIASALGR